MKKLLTILFAVVLGLNLSAQVPDYVPTEGLVAWYPMNNSGDDGSGNGFNGEVVGSTFTTDRFGSEASSAYFDWAEVSGYGNPWHRIEINPGFDGYLEGTFSVAAWINPEHYYWPQNSAHSAMIFGYASRCANTAGLRFSIEGEGALRLRWGNNAISEEGAVALNEWQHVVGTISTDSMRVYINGLQVGAALAIEGPTSGCFNIGELHQANGHWYYFDGAIDDLGVWNHALTEEEILALYNAELPVPGCTDPTACNFDAEVTSDDGSCIASGCMDSEACNYNPLAECEGEACDYTCCPGPGCCSAGMYWDYDLEQCMNYETCQEDLDGDGVIGINDLMELLSSFGTMCEDPEPETVEFTCGDPMNYHGYDYATVQIGEQCWFAENCRHLAAVSPPSLGFEDDSLAHAYVQGYDGASVDEAMTMENYALHGVLYNQLAAESWDICPTGWRVPIDANIPQQGDFEELKLALPANAIGTALKAGPTDVPPWDGNNSSGFMGISSGARSLNWDGEFSWLDITAFYWSQSGWSRRLDSNDENLSLMGLGPAWGLSVRCIQNTEE